MKVALSVWNGRIAPVFDVSRTARILTVCGERILEESTLGLPDGEPDLKIESLIGQGVRVLVCGAISRSVLDFASAQGLRVLPYVAGAVPEVREAYLHGAILKDEYRMPGCALQRRRRRAGYRAGGAGGCPGEA